MTAEQYLSQARSLDRQIDMEIKEGKYLRHLAYSLGSPKLNERVSTSKSTDAPFVRSMDKVMDMQAELDKRIALLVALKQQVNAVIDDVADFEERIILRYRYLQGCSWADIAKALNVDRTTVYRHHNSALSHVRLPKNIIKI